MRIASYNVENLFTRARALNLDSWAEGKHILEMYAELNNLFEEDVYTDAITGEKGTRRVVAATSVAHPLEFDFVHRFASGAKGPMLVRFARPGVRAPTIVP